MDIFICKPIMLIQHKEEFLKKIHKKESLELIVWIV